MRFVRTLVRSKTPRAGSPFGYAFGDSLGDHAFGVVPASVVEPSALRAEVLVRTGNYFAQGTTRAPWAKKTPRAGLEPATC